jgi:hypothetical protein
MSPGLPLIIVILISPLVPTFWAIFDIPKRRFETRRQKMLWFFLVSTFPFVGAMIYIGFVRRRTTPLDERLLAKS